jgi:hypothetical protein
MKDDVFFIVYFMALFNGRGNSLRWPRDTFYPPKLALTSPTSGGRLVGKDRLRTQATEFVVVVLYGIIGISDYIISNGRMDGE